MRRISSLAVLLVVAAPAFARADTPQQLPDGANIAGVTVGGMDATGAEAAVRAALEPVYDKRPVAIRAAHHDELVTPADAGLVVAYQWMVKRAFAPASAHKLRLFRALRLVRTYPVAVGRVGYATPPGLRHVLSKQRNPSWTAPNAPWAYPYQGQTFPPGDPRNPLREWFIALGDGIGIHGTSEEWSVGTSASHGCLRMHASDIDNLAPLVPIGT